MTHESRIAAALMQWAATLDPVSSSDAAHRLAGGLRGNPTVVDEVAAGVARELAQDEKALPPDALYRQVLYTHALVVAIFEQVVPEDAKRRVYERMVEIEREAQRGKVGG